MIGLSAIIILSFITGGLFAFAFFEALGNMVYFIPPMLAVSIGVIYEYYNELRGFFSKKRELRFFELKNAISLGILVISAFLTYFFSANLSFGPVIAAGIVGIFSVLIVKKYSVAAYCGAFVGMVSCDLSQGYWFLTVASLVAGLVYILSLKSFDGAGGKLGTIAFTGCLLSTLLFGRTLLSDTVSGFDTMVFITLYSVIGAILTYIINVRITKDPVLSSSLVGIIAGISLPVIHSQGGDTFAVVAICASFAGMSSKKRLPNEYFVVLAGLFTAVVFILSAPHMGGAGGKLGTIAFGSVLAVSGLHSMYSRIKNYKSVK